MVEGKAYARRLKLTARGCVKTGNGEVGRIGAGLNGWCGWGLSKIGDEGVLALFFVLGVLTVSHLQLAPSEKPHRTPIDRMRIRAACGFDAVRCNQSFAYLQLVDCAEFED